MKVLYVIVEEVIILVVTSSLKFIVKILDEISGFHHKVVVIEDIRNVKSPNKEKVEVIKLPLFIIYKE